MGYLQKKNIRGAILNTYNYLRPQSEYFVKIPLCVKMKNEMAYFMCLSAFFLCCIFFSSFLGFLFSNTTRCVSFLSRFYISAAAAAAAAWCDNLYLDFQKDISKKRKSLLVIAIDIGYAFFFSFFFFFELLVLAA